MSITFKQRQERSKLLIAKFGRPRTTSLLSPQAKARLKAMQRETRRAKVAAMNEEQRAAWETKRDEARDARNDAVQSERLDDIVSCEALWAISPRSPAALTMLLRNVPDHVRHACMDLPWDVDPVRIILGKGPHTLNEIGDAYGLTRERIRQIETGALWRAKMAMKRERVDLPDPPQQDHWDRMGGA